MKESELNRQNLLGTPNIGEDNSFTLPPWIWIYSVSVMVVLSLVLAAMSLMIPDILPREISNDLVLGDPLGLFGLTVTHYFASATGTLFALHRRSTNMLLLVFLLTLLAGIPEMFFRLVYGEPSALFVLFQVLVYWLPSVCAVRALWPVNGRASSEDAVNKIPVWIWVYCIVILILVGLGFAIMLALDPGEVFPELAGQNILSGPAKVFVTMNFATAIAAIIALYRRSANMVLLLFVMMLLADIPDYLFSIFYSEDYLFPFVLFLIFANWIPSALGIRVLWRSTR